MKRAIAILYLTSLTELQATSFRPFGILFKSGEVLTQMEVVGKQHKIAGATYKGRFMLSPDRVPWRASTAEFYNPTFFEAKAVVENDRSVKKGGWADPVEFYKDPNFEELTRKTFSGMLIFDKEGRPLNPMGRTGTYGRGFLGKWGVNLAADPIITRINPETGKLEMLAIKRRDNGMWAIPGGMVDDGDSVSLTLAKEFREECGIEVSKDFMKSAKLIYKGYVDDPRNTDNAWIETVAKWNHLDANNPIASMTPKAGDDAAHAQWKELTPEFINSMYASHPQMLKKVAELYSKKKA